MKRNEEEVPFTEPWQAQAFAMTVSLHQSGLFSWSEWAQTLSEELKAPGADEAGGDYYDHWLVALEKILATKGIANAGDIETLTEAWHRAARATPHGKPILLENDPQAENGDHARP